MGCMVLTLSGLVDILHSLGDCQRLRASYKGFTVVAACCGDGAGTYVTAAVLPCVTPGAQVDKPGRDMGSWMREIPV